MNSGVYRNIMIIIIMACFTIITVQKNLSPSNTLPPNNSNTLGDILLKGNQLLKLHLRKKCITFLLVYSKGTFPFETICALGL